MSDSDTETETEAETVTCLYPGCERDAVPVGKFGGPPPRYCDDEAHNAASTYQALHSKDDDAAAEDA